MWYALLADGVVALHVAYVAFVVFGMLLILLGIVRKWTWVGNRWFRLGHLLAITVVALEALGGIDCPLTVWEARLRHLAGQEAAAGTFVGRLLHNLIFYHFPPWVFTTVYVTFAATVLATLFLAPPRWSASSSSKKVAEKPLAAPPAVPYKV